MGGRERPQKCLVIYFFDGVEFIPIQRDSFIPSSLWKGLALSSTFLFSLGRSETSLTFPFAYLSWMKLCVRREHIDWSLTSVNEAFQSVIWVRSDLAVSCRRCLTNKCFFFFIVGCTPGNVKKIWCWSALLVDKAARTSVVFYSHMKRLLSLLFVHRMPIL